MAKLLSPSDAINNLEYRITKLTNGKIALRDEKEMCWESPLMVFDLEEQEIIEPTQVYWGNHPKYDPNCPHTYYETYLTEDGRFILLDDIGGGSLCCPYPFEVGFDNNGNTKIYLDCEF